MGESHQDLVESYEAFLQDEVSGGPTNWLCTVSIALTLQQRYQDRIALAYDEYNGLKQKERRGMRLTFRPAELRGMPELWNGLRRDPFRHLRALESACHESMKNLRDEKHIEDTRVSISGPLGAAASSPRQLNASSLRQLVCVEGVATQVSAIQPKIVQSKHYCPATNQRLTRNHVDATDPQLGLLALDQSGQEQADRIVSMTTGVYPTQDPDGNPLETEFGLSQYKDHQRLVLQEMPEKAPMGQLPRSVELILDHDWVDKVKPGDRVRVVGVYRALSVGAMGQKSTSGVFRTVVLVNSIQWIGRSDDAAALRLITTDLDHMRQVAQRPDILEVLGRSIAPSIHGHAAIKQALALQLLAGAEKNLANGTHLRGDINILMVGDPSTAKSQLLRAAMKLAPLAISTTGKGSSGVGLTAAVTSDPDTRERRLEAGAMVLADRGLVCVDEFDKMGENDRVAIHEAMEQQTVTIAKAGIHASLNARCAVLAAANPVYGQYDRRRRLHENIGLPDSLLSRFDLLFIVLDQMDPSTDRQIALHVLRGHRSRNHISTIQEDEDEHDEFLGADQSAEHGVYQRKGNNSTGDQLTHTFLRKFLRYAKQRSPTLTNETREWIARQYAELRARQDDRTVPVTARSLETLIRLSTAHAKARLQLEVQIEDAKAAFDILSFALYHEQHASRKTQQPEAPPITDDEDVQEKSLDEERPSKRIRPNDENKEPLEQVKLNILRSVQDSEDGTLDPSGLDIDEDILKTAIADLEKAGRIQMDEGIILSLD